MKRFNNFAESQTEATMTVVFFGAGTEFMADEECDVAAQLQLPESAFERAQAAAQRAGLSLAEFLEDALREKTAQLQSPKPAPKIPRGFFLVNLAGWEQKELQKLARESGVALRTAMGIALRDTKHRLKEWSRLKRLTGLSPSQQAVFFLRGAGTN